MLHGCKFVASVPTGAIAGVAVALLLLAPLAIAGPTPGASAPRRHAAPLAKGGLSSDAAVHPSVGGTRGVFFENTSAVATSAFAAPYLSCTPTPTSSACDSSSAAPSLVNLRDGDLGVAYSVIENSTHSVCGLPLNETVGHVAFAVSSTGGVSWGAPVLLGGANGTCPYNQELEPAFTTNVTGAIEGVYVAAAANLTEFGLNITYGTSGTPSYHPEYVIGYTNRSSDALVYLNSTDNGTTFSSGRIVESGGNLARPAIAAFGRTVYVAYENITNGTGLLPGGAYHPISVQFVASTDGGATWGAPVALPGENASESYTSLSPSVSVSATGEVAVAYVTNRSCIWNCSPLGPTSQFGDDVVVATSSTNGSTWTTHTVFHATGEPSEPDVAGGWQSTVYNYEYYSDEEHPLTALFQFAPPTSIAWNSSGPALFVAWGGSYNNSAITTRDPFGAQAVYTAASPNGGASWSWHLLAPVGGSGAYPGEYDPTDAYNIGLTVAQGTVYLTETVRNLTGYRGGGGVGCGFSSFEASAANDFGTIEWLQNSSNGLLWSPPLKAAEVPTTASTAFAGYDSSLLVRNGTPLVASSLASPLYGGFGSYSGSTLITVSSPDTNAPIRVTFDEGGLPAGTAWPFNVSGNPYSTNGTSLTIDDVPSGFALEVVTTPTIVVNGTLYQAVSGGGYHRFFANGTVWVNYTTVEPFTLQTASTLAESAGGVGGGPRIFGDGSGAAFSIEDKSVGFWYVLDFVLSQLSSGTPYVATFGCPMPWYFPTGYVLHLESVPSYAFLFGEGDLRYTVGLPVTYWSGSGAGNYTGFSANYTVTMSAPINETLWTLPLGSYEVNVSAPGLPTTSNFSFDWDGATFSGTGGGITRIPQVPTGVHTLSDIVAPSTQPGWIWAGRATAGNPVIVPATQSVNLSFSHIDVAAPVGSIHFWAANLTNGTDWQFQFNGTWYSSTTPWINVTAHPGLYPVSARPATSEDATVGYTPSGLAAEWNVTTGRTYVVNYTPAFRVSIESTPGGGAAPTGSFWEAPGTPTTLGATGAFGFQWLGWSGSGPGSYSGDSRAPTVYANGSITEFALFAPDPTGFNLTFNATGLPTGLSWQVSVGGQAFATTERTLRVPGLYSCLVSGAQGEYSIDVPYAYGDDPGNASRYVPASYPALECPGAGGATNLSFAPQYYLTLDAAGNGTAVSTGPENSAASGWFNAGTSISLSAYAGAGAVFAGWLGSGPGSYTGPLATVGISPLGSVVEVATFGPAPSVVPPTYQITFRLAQPVLPGTVWSVAVDGVNYSTTASELAVTSLAAGVHTVRLAEVRSPDGLTRYLPLNASATVTLTSNATDEVTYATSEWLQVVVVGPGEVSPSSEWVAAGTQLELRASPPATGTVVVSWSGSGVGSQTGVGLTVNVTMTGPVTEVVDFAEGAPTAAAAAPGGFWVSDPGLALLVLVGLAVGLLATLGWRRLRRRGPRSGSPTPPDAPRGYSDPGDGRPTDDDEGALRLGGPGSRGHRGRSALPGPALAIVLLMMVSGATPLGGAIGAVAAPSAPHALGAWGTTPSAGPVPVAASGPGDFWLTSPLPPVANNSTCDLYACGAISDTNEPSLNLTSTGLLATAYTAYTNDTPCDAPFPALRNVTEVSIGFSTSSDGGQRWTAPEYLGNDACTSFLGASRYADAWQPALTSLANGTLVLAFVEFAVSANAYDNFPQLYLSQGDYGADRVVVTESYDNGTTWTPTTVLETARSSGGSARSIDQRPTLTAHGQTAYLAWTNVSNDWGTDGAGNATGDSGVHFTTQVNGSAWSAVTELPVTVSANRTAWAAANPYLLALPNGTLVVAYATDLAFNRSFPAAFGKATFACPSYCSLGGGGALVWEIVAGRSNDNGSSFTLHPAAREVEDGGDYASNLMQDLAPEQVLPAPQLTYDPVHDEVVMAYAGDIAFSACDWMSGCAEYAASAIFTANATVTGWSWQSRIASALAGLGNATAGGVEDSYTYLPTIASTSAGTVFLSAQLENASACAAVTPTAGVVMNANYFPMVSPGPVYCSEGMQVVTSSGDDGVTFGPVTNLTANGTWLTDMPQGSRASMVSAGAQVWIAWTQSTCAAWNTTGNGQCGADSGVLSLGYLSPPYLANTTVEVSRLFTGSGATVTFQETGLPASDPWSAELSDNVRAGAAGQNLTVSGVPTGALASWNASPVAVSPFVRYVATPSRAAPGTIAGNTTIVWTYSLQYLVEIASAPAIPASPAGLTWIWTAWWNGNVECLAPPLAFNDGCGGTTVNYNMTPDPGSRWVDAGASVPLQAIPLTGAQFRCDAWWGCSTYQPYLNLTFQSWSGNGSGAYTGTSNQTTLTVRGPINETANFVLNGDCLWFTSIPWNSSCLSGSLLARFHETGLPAGVPWGVSVWGDTPASATPFRASTNNTTLDVVDPQLASVVNYLPYTVPSSTPGDVWAASATPASPLLGPVDGSAALRYHLEPVANGTFQAVVQEQGLPSGTDWSYQVDGQSWGVLGSTGNTTVVGGSHRVGAVAVHFPNGTGYAVQSIHIDPAEMNATWWNVTGNTTDYAFNGSAVVQIVFAPQQRLTVQASVGGTVNVASAWEPQGATVNLTATPDPGDSFVGWTGVGWSSETSAATSIQVLMDAPVSEFATFQPVPAPRYVVTVDALGLPSGSRIAVLFNGSEYAGTAPSFALPASAPGPYALQAPILYANASALARYLPTAVTTTLAPGPAGTYVLGTEAAWFNVTYAVQYLVQVSGSGPGTISPAPGASWQTVGNVTTWTAEPDAGSRLVGWAGSGPGSVNSSAAEIAPQVAGPIAEVATFVPLPAIRAGFTLTVVERGLPSGLTWWVIAQNASANVSAGSGTDTVREGPVSGDYLVNAPLIAPSPGVRFPSNLTNASVSVRANLTIEVLFSAEYLVTVRAAGGGNVTPSAAWAASGASIPLRATPGPGAVFVDWSGTGDGNYSGPSASATLVVEGPITEVALFGAPATPAGATSGAPAYLPYLLVPALAAVGAGIGLALLSRRPPSGPGRTPETDLPYGDPEPSTRLTEEDTSDVARDRGAEIPSDG